MGRFFQWIKSLFGAKAATKEKSSSSGEIHLEPKYWPEVKDYMDTLSAIIEANTIKDDNIQQVNERIMAYVLDQINRKGLIEDFNKRYLALDTLIDRVLVVELGKIVGLKQNEGTRAEFSEVTKAFKKRLAIRKQEEMQQKVM